MTSYANEEDFLKDQIRSNNLAIKFIKEKLDDLSHQFQEDHISTKDKIMNVYLQGIEALEEDSELKKERIKALDNYS
jgi:regulatory protein YycI of two-component signal transduction system YycFG